MPLPYVGRQGMPAFGAELLEVLLERLPNELFNIVVHLTTPPVNQVLVQVLQGLVDEATEEHRLRP